MTIFAWVLQGLLAAMFVMAGMGKIFGSQMHKEGFKKWRLPQWFRVVTGLVEVAAVVLLIIGFWQEEFVLYGAGLLVAVGIGGVLTHVRVKDSVKNTLTITLFGVLALILLLLQL